PAGHDRERGRIGGHLRALRHPGRAARDLDCQRHRDPEQRRDPACDATGDDDHDPEHDHVVRTFNGHRCRVVRVRAIDDTFWDRSRFWSMRGPQSPQQWQLYKSSVIGRASIQRRFRFRSVYSGGGMQIGGGGIGTGGIGNLPAFRSFISIDPVPFDNGSQFVFEYVSNGWCQGINGVPQNSFEADTDVMIDATLEYLLRLSLKYRLLRSLGLSYSEELDEFERKVDKALAHDGGATILNLTPNNNLSLIGPWNLPETGFGNVSA